MEYCNSTSYWITFVIMYALMIIRKSGAFGFFLLFLFFFVGMFVIGFGKAQYQLKFG